MWVYVFFFFFKQKTAYEMRISDWSSDVCSSDLDHAHQLPLQSGQLRCDGGKLVDRYFAHLGRVQRHRLAAVFAIGQRIEPHQFAGQVEADDALVAALAEADGLERPAARYVDRCQYVAVVEQALVALERPPAAHHIIQPRHVVNADIRRQAQLSQRTVPATATQAGNVHGGGDGPVVILRQSKGR